MWGLLGNIKGPPGPAAANLPSKVIWLGLSGPTSGTYTPTVNCKAILVELVSGGGGGGGANGVGAQSSQSGGGAGGNYSSVYIVTPAASYPWTTGAGGAGGIGSTSSSGSDGGASTFGSPSLCAAPGGKGGGPGNSGTTIAISGSPGRGVLTAGLYVGDNWIPGGDGGWGLRLTNATGEIADGGSSVWSGRTAGPNSNDAGGNASSGYGGGGSGAATNSAGSRNGGLGGYGAIRITEFFGDPAGPGGAPAVTSVFGRTGAVAAAASDYSMAQIAGTRITQTLLETVGAGTYTTPANCKAILVECVGGGGGGGGVPGVASQSGVGGGGSGGGYAALVIPAPAATYSYVVGAGGPGGVGNSAGTVGTATTFGSGPLVKGPGGGAGNAGASGTTIGFSAAGGNFQTGWIGLLQVAGGAGMQGIRLSSSSSQPTYGGSSMWGGNSLQGATQNNNGQAGVGYGVGGGGGIANSTTDRNGGAGAQGAIVVTEFY